MSEKEIYSKPHTSYDEQIAILRERNMVITDEAFAKEKLQHISYYRFGSYAHSFRENEEADNFRAGTKFEDVIELYEFDQRLREIVFNALAPIEVSMRTQWAHCLSKKYGSHAHLEESVHNYKRFSKRTPSSEAEDKFKNVKTSLQREMKHSREKFIHHQRDRYLNETPSIWAISEIMTFGLFSRWLGLLSDELVLEEIAKIYNVTPSVLRTWVKNLSAVRNNCAHHNRLWNKKFRRVELKKVNKHRILTSGIFTRNYKLYDSLIVMLYLMDIIEPKNKFRAELKELLEQYPAVSRDDMGFPDGWENISIWQ